MNAEQQMVIEFHRAFGYPVAANPCLMPALADERLQLIREETDELVQAWVEGDLVRVADALGDLLYVTYGTFVACGIDAEPVVAEIHGSNMTKTPGGAKPSKGPRYRRPDIAAVLRGQGANDEPR